MDEISIRPTEASRARLATEALDSSAVQRENSDTQQRKPEPVKDTSGQNTPVREDTGTRAGAKAALETLRKVTEDLNQYFSNSRSIRFQISEDLDELVVQIVDKQSQEVIRSIPPERLMDFKDSFKQISRGILLDDQA